MSDAVVTLSGEIEEPVSLSRDERLQLTWALFWPCAIFSLVDWWVRIQFPFSIAIGGLICSTWVVHRTVGLSFSGFYLVVVRSSGEETRAMNYRESLKVNWLICWRTIVVLGFFGLAVALVLRAFRGGHQLFMDAVSSIGSSWPRRNS